MISQNLGEEPLLRRGYLVQLNYPSQSNFHVNDRIIPNEVCDLGLVPLDLVKDLVIMLNPNDPKNNSPKEVPNRNSLDNWFGDFWGI